MKRILFFSVILIAISLSSCKKNDDFVASEPDLLDSPGSETENQAPGAFTLLQPNDTTAVFSKTPLFIWEQATDPDGDEVTYDLYLDTAEEPFILIAENLTTTSFELKENLVFETQYYWKVVAKDGKGGIRETVIRRLNIEIPVKLLKKYNATFEQPVILINYVDGRIINFGKFLVDLEGDQPKLAQLTNTNNNVKNHFEFTEFDKQKRVYNGDAIDGEEWTFEYDDSDRLNSITKVTRLDQGQGIYEILMKSVFYYDDTSSIYPAQIEIIGEDTFRYSLRWEGANIVEVLSEVDLGMGNDFEFESLTKIAYDENINPNYPIFTKQFGFDPFFVLTAIPSGLGSIDFEFFQWQSFNNITSYEVFGDPAATIVGDYYMKNYMYNESYYPINALGQVQDSQFSFQEDWSYLDQ